MTHYTELPPPLVGCLYCHTEGTITEHSPVRWSRSKVPRLVCSHCGSVAQFDLQEDGSWRIRYRRTSDEAAYYYATLMFADTDWLSEDEAIDRSSDAYVQRRRVEQVRSGQLSWMQPDLPDDRPGTIMPDEHALVYLENVVLRRRAETDEGIQTPEVDHGGLFLTDRRLHLQGQQRVWSYEYAAVAQTSYEKSQWTLTFSDAHLIQHEAGSKEPNAQLIVSLVELLKGGGARLLDNR